MNKVNLLKMVDHLRTISPENFDMQNFRKDRSNSSDLTTCNTVACVIGHCTVLDTKENLSKFYFECPVNMFDYRKWIMSFIDIESYLDYGWLFSGIWTYNDNTIEGAIKRILNFIDNNGMTDEDRNIYNNLTMVM